MTKYKQEVKDAAVKAAKEGVHLKTIQSTIGPNPAATKRYLAAAGIDYKEVLAELKKTNNSPKTVVQEGRDREKAAKTAKKETVKTEVRQG